MPSPPSTTTGRAERRVAILRIVAEQGVHSQAELQELLAADGFQANQGTLSRDLRELGVVKSADGYVIPDGPALGGGDELTQNVRQWLDSAVTAQNLIVLRTPPSGAQPLALAIDRDPPAGVVGTIGGDDTILVICADRRAAARVARELLDRKGGAR